MTSDTPLLGRGGSSRTRQSRLISFSKSSGSGKGSGTLAYSSTHLSSGWGSGTGGAAPEPPPALPPPVSRRGMSKRPTILVTNEDGIHSPGLKALAGALEEVGELSIIAPDRERSAAGHSLTL